MGKFFLSFWLTCFASLPMVWAQLENPAMGGRAKGIANASVAVRDHWALFNNIGGLAGIKKYTGQIAYNNRFGIANFQTFALGITAPVKVGAAGLSVSRFGDNLYSEQRIGIGYSHQIKNVSLGGKVNYVQVSIQDLGSKGTLVFEFGGIARLSKEVLFGAHIYNFNQGVFNTALGEEEKLPVIMKAGISYQPLSALMINAETEKNIDLPATFKVGLEYEIVPQIYVRTGIQTQPMTNYFGVGFQPKRFHLNYALTTNNLLGISHHLSFTYQLGKK
ncbi:PorV/PorQ family protein [Microscilla marina]|nr:hypothetical protein [Microscilla marina]